MMYIGRNELCACMRVCVRACVLACVRACITEESFSLYSLLRKIIFKGLSSANEYPVKISYCG